MNLVELKISHINGKKGFSVPSPIKNSIIRSLNDTDRGELEAGATKTINFRDCNYGLGITKPCIIKQKGNSLLLTKGWCKWLREKKARIGDEVDFTWNEEVNCMELIFLGKPREVVQETVGPDEFKIFVEMAEKFYKDKLFTSASHICKSGKCVIAGDAFQELLLTTEPTLDVFQYLSGVILSDETIRKKKNANGINIVDVLYLGGVLVGLSEGPLSSLERRCNKYYCYGVRFAECSAVFQSGPETTSVTILEAANLMAQYAIICQGTGIVPILEPNILIDPNTDVNFTKHVLATIFNVLNQYNVLLAGTVLKFIVETNGTECRRISMNIINALMSTVPPAVPGIIFCPSEDTSLFLGPVYAVTSKMPWSLSMFCHSNVLQAVHEIWQGGEENLKEAQEAFRAGTLWATQRLEM